MNTEFRTPWLDLIDDIADRADEISMEFFQAHDLSIDTKPDESPVTEADRAIERMARERVRARAPELGVLGEEQGETPGAGSRRLIIDPIDGTRNFMRGIPIFATLLAVEDDGEIEVGVVSAPALQTRWRAVRGRGAYRGDRRLGVSNIATIQQAQIFHGDLGGTREPHPPPGFFTMLQRCARSRGFGDFYQHLLVAEGAGELAVDPGVSPWDIAPLTLIAEESGGRATSFAGTRTIYGGSLVTSNGALHDAALNALTGE